MSKLLLSITTLLAVLAAQSAAYAEDPAACPAKMESAADFGVGEEVTEAEAHSILYCLSFWSLKALPGNRVAIKDIGGDVRSEAELHTVFERARKIWIVERLEDTRRLYPMSTDQFDRRFASDLQSQGKKRIQLPLLLRATYNDLPVADLHFSATSKENDAFFRKANPATFSYTRDIEGNEDTWETKAAILYPWEVPNVDPDGVNGIYFMPSVSFERLSSDDSNKKEVNSFTPRLTGEVKWFLGESLGVFVRASLAYGTDFEFDDQVLTGEFEVEPVWHWGPLTGDATRMFGSDLGFGDLKLFEYYLRQSVVVTVGNVINDGNNGVLDEGDDSTRIGPRIQLDILPVAPLERLSFSIAWTALHEVSGDLGNSRLFEAQGKYDLDDRGHLSVTAKYRNGDVPLLDQAAEDFTLGIGIKF